MKYILLLIICVSIGHVQADTKLSLQGSLLHNVPDTSDLDGDAQDEPGTGFGLGLRALMGIKNQLHLRSGAAIVQRNFKVEFDSPLEGDWKLSFTYLAIPLTIYWKAAPTVGLFAGTALNAKMSDSCKDSGAVDCDLEDEKSLVFPAIIGFDFNFTDSFGMEVSYEHALTETAKDLKVNSAVLSLLYHFP